MFKLVIFADSDFNDSLEFFARVKHLCANISPVRVLVMSNKASNHLESMAGRLPRIDQKFSFGVFQLADLPKVLGECNGWLVFTYPKSPTQNAGKKTPRGYTIWNINACFKYAAGRGRVVDIAIDRAAQKAARKASKTKKEILREIRTEFKSKDTADREAVLHNYSYHQVGATLGELFFDDSKFAQVDEEYQRYMAFERAAARLPGLDVAQRSPVEKIGVKYDDPIVFDAPISTDRADETTAGGVAYLVPDLIDGGARVAMSVKALRYRVRAAGASWKGEYKRALAIAEQETRAIAELDKQRELERAELERRRYDAGYLDQLIQAHGEYATVNK